MVVMMMEDTSIHDKAKFLRTVYKSTLPRLRFGQSGCNADVFEYLQTNCEILKSVSSECSSLISELRSPRMLPNMCRQQGVDSLIAAGILRRDGENVCEILFGSSAVDANEVLRPRLKFTVSLTSKVSRYFQTARLLIPAAIAGGSASSLTDDLWVDVVHHFVASQVRLQHPYRFL